MAVLWLYSLWVPCPSLPTIHDGPRIVGNESRRVPIGSQRASGLNQGRTMIVLLIGPSGVGKTKTYEAVAGRFPELSRSPAIVNTGPGSGWPSCPTRSAQTRTVAAEGDQVPCSRQLGQFPVGLGLLLGHGRRRTAARANQPRPRPHFP